jgi:hypothetical protein
MNSSEYSGPTVTPLHRISISSGLTTLSLWARNLRRFIIWAAATAASGLSACVATGTKAYRTFSCACVQQHGVFSCFNCKKSGTSALRTRHHVSTDSSSGWRVNPHTHSSCEYSSNLIRFPGLSERLDLDEHCSCSCGVSGCLRLMPNVA